MIHFCFLIHYFFCLKVKLAGFCTYARPAILWIKNNKSTNSPTLLKQVLRRGIGGPFLVISRPLHALLNKYLYSNLLHYFGIQVCKKRQRHMRAYHFCYPIKMFVFCNIDYVAALVLYHRIFFWRLSYHFSLYH
jgi:hypothetical protein